MRILQIGQIPKEMGGNYTTGIARVIGELSFHSFGDGIDMYFYATNISDKRAQKIFNSNCKFLGYSISPIGFFWDLISHPVRTYKEIKRYKETSSANPLHFAFYRYNFFHAIMKVKPDLIHFHGGGIVALSFANKKTNIPVLNTLHGLMWCGEDNEDPNELLLKQRYEKTLPLADFYTTLNINALNKMLKLGVEKERIKIIPNGVDSKKFYYSEKFRLETRQLFNADGNCKVFITVGKVLDRKGQFAFLKILSSLPLNFQYWIVGEGPDLPIIKEYAREKGIEDKVKIIGYVKDTDMYKYLSAADFYAHTSTIEGQALSEIEAYATGLRIVVNRMVANTVIGNVEKEKDTYYVADFSSINSNNILEWLNREQCERKSRGNYDWSIIAKLYGEAYKACIR